jgi:uncharacterized protein YjbJ (UPF0337 family)
VPQDARRRAPTCRSCTFFAPLRAIPDHGRRRLDDGPSARPLRDTDPDKASDRNIARPHAHNPEGKMTQEQFRQSWDQIKGDLKRRWVKLTDEDILQIDGDQGRFNGAIQRRYDVTKGEVSRWADRWYAKWTGWYEGYEEAKPVVPAVPGRPPAS